MSQSSLQHTIQKIRQLKLRWEPRLKNIGLDTGLIRGHTQYTRFILLGRSRVGSNFLRGLLNSHSQISVYGEIFQNDQTIGWALPGFPQTPRLMAQFKNDPIRFLEHRVFKRFPLGTVAVGFKLFYYHAHNQNWEPIWAYLHNHKEIKIIHIKRRNILQTHLSRQRAELTDLWVNTAGTAQTETTVYLDYAECLNFFEKTRRWETEYDIFFQRHPTCVVFYEELARDYANEMKRIQGFLGVAYQPVKPETHKQSHRPLPEAIANYADLKKKFRGTPWESFFED